MKTYWFRFTEFDEDTLSDRNHCDGYPANDEETALISLQECYPDAWGWELDSVE